ncbi:hypothetical protein NRB20_44460 [Nocardia sp. RB20]|uniref:WD40 repeat domain-containing protein n=1 Tax=Nocardia macrotermitis TaxID=2585198 RepID=A0A7K0D6F1_9NOCA|nr:hypothetical protein [Nocardia macrotermitis]
MVVLAVQARWESNTNARQRDDAQSPGLLVFRPDGRQLAIGGTDGRIRLWDTSNPDRPVRVGQFVSGRTDPHAVYTPDGRMLAVIGTPVHAVRFWDVHDPAHARPVGRPVGGVGTPIVAIEFDSRGQRFATLGGDTTIQLWDFTDPAHITETGGSIIPTEDSWHAGDIAFTPDGEYLIGVGVRGEIRWWDLNPDHSLRRVCRISGDVLTADVWRRYLPGVPYRAACEGQA